MIWASKFPPAASGEVRGIRFAPAIATALSFATLGPEEVMHAQSESRELRPAFTFRGLVTGWCCSVCEHAFHIPLAEATDILAAPEGVQREFERHACSKAMAESQSGS